MGDADLNLTAELRTWHPDYRLEGLKAAVVLYADRRDWDDESTGQKILHAAGEFAAWLAERPSRITVADPVITAQGVPGRPLPLHRGADMAVTMTDGDQAAYPAPEALDSKGFPVADTITVTNDDTAAAIVTQVSNPDGSVTFVAVGPGTVQATWTDGVLTFSDTLNVTAGAAASLVVGAPVVTPQA